MKSRTCAEDWDSLDDWGTGSLEAVGEEAAWKLRAMNLASVVSESGFRGGEESSRNL